LATCAELIVSFMSLWSILNSLRSIVLYRIVSSHPLSTGSRSECNPLQLSIYCLGLTVSPIREISSTNTELVKYSYTQRSHFYPLDAMLARVFARATCPSVCHTPVLYQNEES